MPRARVDDLGLDLPHRRVRVDQDRRQREQREREQRRHEARSPAPASRARAPRATAACVRCWRRRSRTARRGARRRAARRSGPRSRSRCASAEADSATCVPSALEETLRMREDELPGFDEQHLGSRGASAQPDARAARDPGRRSTASAHAVSAPVQIFGAWSLLMPLKISVPRPPAFT